MTRRAVITEIEKLEQGLEYCYDDPEVAAGAVVTHAIPDNTLVGGVPARKIKDIENDVEAGYTKVAFEQNASLWRTQLYELGRTAEHGTRKES